MSTSTKKYSILFVDDEKRILTALRSIFRREYDVHIANGGHEALEILARQPIDVIVSDQRMPNMLGSELLAEVHQHYPQTMRLLLTGFMDKEAIIKTINEGEIYRFINKPWRNDEIHKTIAEAALASEFVVEDISSSSESAAPVVSLDSSVAATTQEVGKLKGAQAMLMMGSSQVLRNQIRHLCRQHSISIYGTQSIPQAVGVVSAKPSIGVSVIELPVNTDEAMHTISVLKEQRPEMITIVLADEIDAEVAVDLINTGQVFRYLTKPLQTDKLEKAVQQAFIRHNILKKNAHAQQRYKVERLGGKITSGLKELFTSFGLLRKHV